MWSKNKPKSLVCGAKITNIMYGHICSSLKCVPVNICPHVIMFVMLPENLEFKIFIKKYVHQFIALFWQALWFGNCLINPSYFLNNRRHFMLRTKNFFSTVGIFRKGPKNYIATFPLYWGYIYRAKSTCSQQICNMIFRKWGGGFNGRLELFRKFIRFGDVGHP